MVDTVFVDKDASTPIVAAWLNDVNNVVYRPDKRSNLGGLAIPNFSLSSTTPGQEYTVADTNALHWAAGPGRMIVNFNVVFTNFFAANPNAHMAVVLRNTSAVIATSVLGEGVLIGNATTLPSGEASNLNPTALLETWMNNIPAAPSGNYVWGNSEVARSLGLHDNTTYKFIIEATKTIDGNRYIRYRIWTQDPTLLNWKPIGDSGDVLDHNVWADLTQSGITFGYVFQSNLSSWSIDVTGCQVTWGPAETSTPDQTVKLSRYGAQLEGDLNFIGATPRITVPTTAGPSLAGAATVQSSAINGATNLVFKPNGTNRIANAIFSNDSSSVNTYGALTLGMDGTKAKIITYGFNAVNPVLDIDVGFNNIITTFTETGMAFSADHIFTTYQDGGPGVSHDTAFQSGTPNGSTSIIVKPNGSSTAANFFAVDSSSGASSYRGVAFGMGNNVAVINTLGYSLTTPPLVIQIGGATVATFTSTGISMAASTRTIGVSNPYIGAGITGFGGPNAVSGMQGSTLAWDDICGIGFIANFLGATYSATTLENAMRPLYEMVSVVIKDLKDKKVS